MSYRQCRRIAVRSRTNCRNPFLFAVAQVRVAWKVWSKLFGNTDRAYARTTATVRDCKSLVKVKVTNVGTNNTRISKTNLCVHVCSVYVYQTTVIVYDFYHLTDLNLEHTMCRRVGDHCARETVLILLCFLTELIYVYVSFFVAGN